MTADRPPPRPPVDDATARNRFLVISLMRFMGVAMILFAILVLNGVVVLPPWTAWVLIVLGVLETFLVPTLLARLWSSERK